MRFDYHRPVNVSDAVALLASSGPAGRPIAYGSDLIVWAKERQRETEAVIDLTGVEGLAEIRSTEEHLEIGACASLAALGRHEIVRERFPALALAVGVMGSVQLREGASLGGNVCTASPAGDSGPPLLCYEARMIAAGPEGERAIPAVELYAGPGRTTLKPDEILVRFELPWPPEGAVGTYLKGARRAAVDLAVVSVAAVAYPDPSAASGVSLRLALGAVAPTPVRAERAEALVAEAGLPLDSSDEAGQALAEAARESAAPVDDARASAEYRRTLVGRLAAQAGAELAAALAPRQAARGGER